MMDFGVRKREEEMVFRERMGSGLLKRGGRRTFYKLTKQAIRIELTGYPVV